MFDYNTLIGKISTRRVQKTGGSSYVITLPKKWLESFIEDEEEIKGTALGLIIQADNTLLVTPELSKRRFSRKKVILIDQIEDPNYFFRYLISTYIAGFTEIEIQSNKTIAQPFRAAIRHFIQTVRYQEIIEEKDQYILIKDLFNPEEMPFHNIIDRMHMTARNMHRDAIYAFKNNDRALLDTIAQRDNDVDRLYWLVARLTNMIMRDITLSEKIGITSGTAANFFLIARMIERIADHAVRLSENVELLLDQSIDKDIVALIEKAVDIGLKVFQNSIEALFQHDIIKANANIESTKPLDKISTEIMNYTFKQESIMAIPLDNIVESIRRLQQYSRDISENVMNYILVLEERPYYK